MTDPATLARLSDELAATGARLSVLADWVARASAAPAAAWTAPPVPGTAPTPAAPVPPAPVGPPPPDPTATWGRAPLPSAPPPVPVAASGGAPGPGWLDRDGAGQRWLSWVGGGVTLAGVVLLLVLAAQRGWLGPLPRVLAGAVLGTALVGIGMAVHRRAAGRAGALALVGTGVAALYLDVVAATARYALLPEPAGLAAGLLVAGTGLALADRWRSELLGGAAVVGAAVLAPVVAGGVDASVVAFALVLQVAAAPVHVRRQWGVLALLAAVPPALAASVLALVVVDGAPPLRTAVVVPLAAAAGLVVALVSALRPGTPAEVAAPGLVVAPVPVVVLAGTWGAPAGAVLAGALAAVLLGAWAVLRARALGAPPVVGLLGAWGAVALTHTLVVALDGQALALALLGQAVIAVAAALALQSRGVLDVALAQSALASFAAVLTAVPVPPVVAFPAAEWVQGGERAVGDLVAAVVGGALLAVLAAAGPAVAVRLGALRAVRDHAGLWAAAVAGVLHGTTSAVLAVAVLVRPDRTAFLTGHAVVTVAWTVAALALLVRGLRSTPSRVLGMALVAAALAKLVLFDLAALDGVARVAAFLGAGLVLLAAGTRYAQLLAERDEAAAEVGAAP